MQKLFFILALFFICLLFFPSQSYAVTATGRWHSKSSDAGSVKLSFPAKGGRVEGTFSGGGGGTGYGMQYGGRFSGNFTGGWSGTFSGSFSGWVNVTYNNPATGESEMQNYTVAGPWHGSISLDGTGRASFDNQAAGGESGTATFNFSKSAFEREYGESLVEQKAKEAVEEYQEYEAQEAKKDQEELEEIKKDQQKVEEVKKAQQEQKKEPAEEGKDESPPPTADYGPRRSSAEGWEEEFLETRARERHQARGEWFRQRYREDDRYAKMMGRDNSSFFFSENFFNAMEHLEKNNDKIVLNAVKVLNAIEEEFLKAFGDALPQKTPT